MEEWAIRWWKQEKVLYAWYQFFWYQFFFGLTKTGLCQKQLTVTIEVLQRTSNNYLTCTRLSKVKLNYNNSSIPGAGRPRGGEFAADDCWLDGYHEDSVPRPSYWALMGDVVPDVFWGDPAAEYLIGDPVVDMFFGVPVGVSRGVIYGVIENLCAACFEAVEQTTKQNKYII